jgi:hypothetical protein
MRAAPVSARQGEVPTAPRRAEDESRCAEAEAGGDERNLDPSPPNRGPTQLAVGVRSPEAGPTCAVSPGRAS